MKNTMLVSPSPHIHANVSTRSLMLDVIIALTPAIVVSVLFYGWSELLILAVSVASCVLLEWAITKYMLKAPSTIGDMSAVVTGLLLAMNLPSTTPWWVVFIGALVSIGVAKMTFGGIGQNPFNPAITGRVFLLISFPTYMTDWTVPQGFIHSSDAVSGATLLGRYAEGGVEAVAGTDYLNTLFLNIGGSAGEISTLALLVGFAYLLVRKVIKPWITLSIFATIAVFSGIFWMIDPSTYTDPLFNLLTGGVVLGACFMATDYVTSPMSNLGGVIYGIGIGLLVMLIRYFGAYPEGMSFAILIMNMVVPLLNNWCHQKKYGRS
ncbi:MAG: RnfABCDGE type electron transport complex subunit D [Bacteroidales bacterium]|nr:RnfABCDGE type electron transport complex subunit D [Bacteroidales bacterium]MDD7607965.1 RnfABCDGE type electron transport complex subunit D [Bacteroidales bacterium]MDY5459400.1 RnfABCDGE type electron transport complex subunit D [Candidatus Cryptobacteroides sp.]MEE0341114.1 RnfABCDGE type electron transport complex subunit D [Bacteroidales bacterium]